MSMKRTIADELDAQKRIGLRPHVVVLAVAWGALVYAVQHDIGYEKATGYPPLSEGLLWARHGMAKYLRWLCAAALAAEAVYLMIFTWLKILGGIPLLGVLLLLWSDMGERNAAWQTNTASPELTQEKLERKHRNRWINGTAISGLAALLVWWAWFHNPLPSDAEMIARFKANRSGFEQLVQGVRNYREIGAPYPYVRSSNEVRSLVKRLGIFRITWGGFWYPAPYSERTARLTGEFIGHTMEQRSHVRTLEQMLDYWKANMPELFEGVAPVTYYPQVNQLTGIIFFTMGSAKRPDTKFTLRYGGLQKGYRHYPQVPQVKDGHILIPDYDLNNKPIVRAGDRVLDSLDDYPPDWKRGECVLKRIDDYWFIQMCRAA
jgi:hypothetical protein